MRAKQHVAKPDNQKTQVDPREVLRLQITRLEKTNDQITKALSAYRLEEAQKETMLAEYYQLKDKIENQNADRAEPSTYAYGKVSIDWTEKHRSECRRASVTIPNEWDKPIVFVKGDEQLGHVTCDEERVKKDIAWVQKNPQCLVMLIGDAIDSATKTSPGSIRENNRGPLQQISDYVEMHKSIQDRIVGFVGGNHERRIDKALDEGGAAIRLLAGGLSRDDHKIPFSSGILLLDLYWKGHCWTFTMFHGAGAAATPGSQIQRLQRNIMLTDSMITVSGHLHSEQKTSRRFVRRGSGGSISIAKQTSLQCGTYLKYLGSYGEVGGMSPTGPDMVVIELQADGGYLDRFKGQSDF